MSEVLSGADEADRHEQQQTVTDDLADELARDSGPLVSPLEANEADVAEQHRGETAEDDDDAYPSG